MKKICLIISILIYTNCIAQKHKYKDPLNKLKYDAFIMFDVEFYAEYYKYKEKNILYLTKITDSTVTFKIHSIGRVNYEIEKDTTFLLNLTQSTFLDCFIKGIITKECVENDETIVAGSYSECILMIDKDKYECFCRSKISLLESLLNPEKYFKNQKK